ncbi:uncharacterized protein LOC118450510 [Vespa mandarinia]|uniref:uncharacterized protein LOC118450510 n=1 Tax=Vespa mandarinia TaxID=7446 RepID=UPI0016108CDB|nr:uncharacterized protein LOC118450510 [Vespa mandarinia]
MLLHTDRIIPLLILLVYLTHLVAVGSFRSPTKEYKYCKNYGHTIEECRKKKWQEHQSSKNGRANYVHTVRLSSNPSSSSVVISSKDLKGEIEFLVDIGSEPNILKIDKADDYLMSNETNKINLSGITKETVGTYGTCIIDIYGYPVEFHIVPDSFPIPHGGIIGSDFFKDVAKINFIKEDVEWHGMTMPFVKPKEIPARTSNIIKIKTLNKENKIHYVPPLKLGEGIYVGEVIINSNNGKAFIKVFNTKEEDVNVIIPKIELQDFDTVDTCIIPSPELGSRDREKEEIRDSYLSVKNNSSNLTNKSGIQTLSPLGQDNDARDIERLMHETEISKVTQSTKAATSPSLSLSSHTRSYKPVTNTTSYAIALQNIDLKSLNAEEIRTTKQEDR